MTRLERWCAALLLIGAYYAGCKTGRGQAWDQRQALRDEAKRANANADALEMCEAGATRDERGFWR